MDILKPLKNSFSRVWGLEEVRMALAQAVSLTRMRVVTQCRQGVVGEAAPPCGQFTGAGSDRASRGSSATAR